MPIKTENFDELTTRRLLESLTDARLLQDLASRRLLESIALTLPSGWTFDSPLVLSNAPTGGIVPTSSPNVLALLAPGNNTQYFGTYKTLDSNGGNISVQCNFNAASTLNNQTYGLIARSNSNAFALASSTGYWAQVSPNGLVARISKIVGGVNTVLSPSVIITSMAEPTWYQIKFTLNLTTLSLTVQRMSDNFWLNSSGNFQSGSTSTISLTDSAISGSGYSGLSLQSRSDNAYADDWVLSAVSLAAPVFSTRRGAGDLPYNIRRRVR